MPNRGKKGCLMAKHVIYKCSVCWKVIAQCRCMARNKAIEYRVCDACKKKGCLMRGEQHWLGSLVKCTVESCRRIGQYDSLYGPMCSPRHALLYEAAMHGWTSHEMSCPCHKCKAWRQTVGKGRFF